MCGIIGILGREDVAPRLVDALKRLEYRGYDSAGVATLEKGRIARRRAPGKLKALETALAANPLSGSTGIGHTRWATHGAPNENNAHPHATEHVAIVHNGIIENFRSLREELIAQGQTMSSATDSEVIAHLITVAIDKGLKPREAVQATIERLQGAFAIACLFEGEDDLLIGARKGSPLVVGLGDGENYLGSDALAVDSFTNRVIYLEEGDLAELSRETVRIFDAAGQAVERPVTMFQGGAAAVEKGNHRHFMQKEIYEQSETTARTIARYVDAERLQIVMPELDTIDLKNASSALLIGCGTAFYAGMVGEYWLERIARLPVETDLASEFRYREAVLPAGQLAVFISQSGETADTLAALRHCKAGGLSTLGVVNVPQSSIWREAASVVPTLAGPEIGVASTKAFTAQLCALAAFAVAAAKARGEIDAAQEKRLCGRLLETPRLIAEALRQEPQIAAIAQELSHARDVLYLGRGQNYPLALEGALKLKEISYIHAEGYAAGELKHGPIALIDEATPVVVCAPHDSLFEKTLSNMEEVAARGGKIILISDEAGHKAAGSTPASRILAPACDPLVAPIVYAIAIQLLAYHTAVLKGTDVDQPRNLAKSVTVE
jgi:glucosamine--fructose-6-phosphate aminotransferase (isomerizing)